MASNTQNADFKMLCLQGKNPASLPPRARTTKVLARGAPAPQLNRNKYSKQRQAISFAELIAKHPCILCIRYYFTCF